MTVDGNNFPDKLCICLVISFLQLMSCHLELLTGFSAQHEDFGLLICQSENQAVAATAVWACSVEYTMLAAEGTITVWNTPDASSILSTLLSMKAGCVHPSSETSRGWFLLASQPGTIYVWDCARTLGNAALCSISRLVPNSPACSLKGPDKAFPSRGLSFLEFFSLQRREFRVFSS